MSRIRKLFLLGLLALVAPVFLVACGDDNSDVDPEQVLTETFSNDEMVSSGNIDLSLSGSLEGEPTASGEASIGGPFQADPENPTAMPQFDFTVSANGEADLPTGSGSLSFDGGLTATTDNLYVEYQGTTYELGSDIYQQFQSFAEQAAAQAGGATGAEGATAAENFDQQCATLLEMAGGNEAACETIDVFSWFELSNEGTEEIEGTDTIHVHGEVDIPAMIENINAAIEASEIPDATPIPEEDAAQAEEAIESLTFDVYSGAEDRLLRGLNLDLAINGEAIPAEELDEGQNLEAIDLGFESRISGVNEEQTIEAPADAQPIDGLLSQFGLSADDINAALEGYSTQFGLGGLGATGAGGALGGGGGSAGGSLEDSGGSAGGGGAGSIDDKYFDCISESKSANPFKECEQFLN